MIEIDITSALKAKRRLDRLSRTWTRVFMRGAAAIAEAGTKRRISTTKKDPDGNRWERLKPGYAARVTVGSMLNRSRQGLLSSITARPQGDQVIVGSPLRYAAAHQFGYEPRNLPARPFLGLDERDKRKLNTLVDRVLSRMDGV